MENLSLYERTLIQESPKNNLDLHSVSCPCTDCKIKDCPIITNGSWCAQQRNWLLKLRALEKLEKLAANWKIDYYDDEVK